MKTTDSSENTFGGRCVSHDRWLFLPTVLCFLVGNAATHATVCTFQSNKEDITVLTRWCEEEDGQCYRAWLDIGRAAYNLTHATL